MVPEVWSGSVGQITPGFGGTVQHAVKMCGGVWSPHISQEAKERGIALSKFSSGAAPLQNLTYL